MGHGPASWPRRPRACEVSSDLSFFLYNGAGTAPASEMVPGGAPQHFLLLEPLDGASSQSWGSFVHKTWSVHLCGGSSLRPVLQSSLGPRPGPTALAAPRGKASSPFFSWGPGASGPV